MKKIACVIHFDKENMVENGFKTEQQQKAVCCVGDLMESIKSCGTQKFGMMIYFITDGDLLGDQPVTIWSNFTIGEQRKIFEDYILKRLKMKESA